MNEYLDSSCAGVRIGWTLDRAFRGLVAVLGAVPKQV